MAVIGTHNSDKQPMPAAPMAKIRTIDPAMAEALDYSHRSLVEQLDAGARQFEIDVNYDPQGGHYARSSNDPKLMQPGFKVLPSTSTLKEDSQLASSQRCTTNTCFARLNGLSALSAYLGPFYEPAP